jgi:uncharacterized C2H2 Zn-finger protein
MTPNVIYARKLKAAPKPKGGDSLQCDQCTFRAKTKQALVWHRIAEHQPHANLKCPHCDFTAKWKGGLTLHVSKAHRLDAPPAEPAPTNGKRKYTRREIDQPAHAIIVSSQANGLASHAQEGHPVTDGIPEGTLALALGRFQELCRSIAFEHDLPPRMFAARLAGLIYAATVR